MLSTSKNKQSVGVTGMAEGSVCLLVGNVCHVPEREKDRQAG